MLLRNRQAKSGLITLHSSGFLSSEINQEDSGDKWTDTQSRMVPEQYALLFPPELPFRQSYTILFTCACLKVCLL